nr:transposase [Mesorhizobium sp.]
MRRLAPDYRTIAAFRHDNPEAIIAASAAFVQFCRDQGALDRMEARIYADPSLMTIRRCTVEHPFGTIKRMSGCGRFLTRGLRAVKPEAALSILAFNILRAVNAFGTTAIRPS